MKHETLTQKLIGIFYTIYNELGHGFLENVYQKSFVVILREQELTYQAQMPMKIMYHGIDVGDYFADLVVESTVLVELKAVNALESAHEKQVLNYLKATNLEVGLLFNFGPRPQVRRLIFDNDRKRPEAAIAQASSS